MSDIVERPGYPQVTATFINAIAEEGTKAEAVEWLQKQWNETCALRTTNAELLDALKKIITSPDAIMRDIARDAIAKATGSLRDGMSDIMERRWGKAWRITEQEHKAMLDEIARLRAALKKCADDLEIMFRSAYRDTLDYPSMNRRFDRDMKPVVAARKLLGETK
jgi:hypothetical protein